MSVKRYKGFKSIFVFFCLLVNSTIVFALDNIVICTEENCPTIESVLASNKTLGDKVIVFQSTNKKMLMQRFEKAFEEKNNGGWQNIHLFQDVYEHLEPIIGFGGAFTDSSAILYHHLSTNLQNALVESYFSDHGIAYSLGRVPIASTDFSCRDENNLPALNHCSYRTSSYFYLNDETDEFHLQLEDITLKIPMIQQALKKVSYENENLKLFASPWSAPAFMKTSAHVIHGSLLPQFYKPWADYLINFLTAYAAHDIYFWGMTVENEPVEDAWSGQNQFQQWQTMYFSKELEAYFVKKFLGPALKKYKNQSGREINLMIHDDQVKTIDERMTMINDPELAQYVNGAGVHWYMNSDNAYSRLDIAYQELNNGMTPFRRFILATEACTGYLPYEKGPQLGSWSRGEQYAHDIIQDLNHHVSGWTDWNLMLDLSGGPNWAENMVDAPILVDLRSKRFYKQPMYYFLGHFSKFIRPGSYLLASESKGMFALEEVSFKVPAHHNLPQTIVVVVLNRDITGRKYYVKDNSRPKDHQYINMEIPARSIQTIVYKANDPVND